MPSAFGGGHGNRNMIKGKIKNDLIFIAILMAVATLAGLAILVFRGEGDRVVVSVDGEEYGVYALDRDTEVDIRTGEEGEQLNRLIIRDGSAYVELATCPDGICSAHKPISKDGESIVCLPHRVIVTVEASTD